MTTGQAQVAARFTSYYPMVLEEYQHMKKRLILSLIFLLMPQIAFAQTPECQQNRAELVQLMVEACGMSRRGEVCNATVDQLDEVRSLSADDGSLLRINLPDIFSETDFATFYLIGPATLTVEDNAFTLNGDAQATRDCALPSGLLVQAPLGQLVVTHINQVELTFNDSLFITAAEDELVINVLRGNAVVRFEDATQVALAGYALNFDGDSVEVEPYHYEELRNLPTELLPGIVTVGLPGNVRLIEASPLYETPAENAAIVVSLRASTLFNVLGQDPTGEWWHVVREDGVTGWLPAPVLDGTLPDDAPAYESTPQPLTRPYGLVAGHAHTPNHLVNLREGPYADAPVIVQLEGRTEFGVMGRNETGEWLQIILDEPVGDDAVNTGWIATWILPLPDSIRVNELPVVETDQTD